MSLPNVLVIDDDPDAQRATFRHAHGEASFVVVHPAEVTEDHLRNADLVLVDYVIEDWPDRMGSPQIGLRPANGVALAAVLREHASRSERPTGFAVHTGQPEALWLTPAESRRHLIARAYNLEWVFLKADPSDVIRQATILAGAIRSLPVAWPVDDYDHTLEKVAAFLGLPTRSNTDAPNWVSPALAEVQDCRPPLTELSERNHGLVFLRWLLHRILPYPCFLLDSHRLAARLRVTHASFEHALASGLGDSLSACRYRGALAGYLGDRWWRAGVEDWLWDLTDGASLPAAELRAKLIKVASVDLVPTTGDNPIVCVDEDYQTLQEALPATEVVRIQPDDWPLYASQAWAAVEAARQHPRLRAIVAAEDREKVSPADQAQAGEGGRE